jgi:biotin-[acetyl-CoA-carboxylase] ligase BirA-like protein
MRLLTDCPEVLDAWRPASGWQPGSRAAWSEAESALWEALGGPGRVWGGRAREVGPARFFSLLLGVKRAPESQFDRLRRLLADGLVLPGPVACFALEGQRFHGHHGRAWVAAAGNLQLSVALDTGGLPASESAALTMLPAVAVVDAIARLGGGTLAPGIKWVNDVLLEGRKVAGVLTATQVSGRSIGTAVLGIGVNVAKAPDVPPTPFVPAVGSLAGTGAELVDVLGAILVALGERFETLLSRGGGPIHEAYRRASVVIGREVVVQADSRDDDPLRSRRLAQGVVRDIARDLSLLLEGRSAPVSEGRLILVEPSRER